MFSCEIREYFSLGKIFSKALSAENQLFLEAQSQKAATNIDIKSNQSVSQYSSSIRSALTNAFSCFVHLLYKADRSSSEEKTTINIILKDNTL